LSVELSESESSGLATEGSGFVVCFTAVAAGQFDAELECTLALNITVVDNNNNNNININSE